MSYCGMNWVEFLEVERGGLIFLGVLGNGSIKILRVEREGIGMYWFWGRNWRGLWGGMGLN